MHRIWLDENGNIEGTIQRGTNSTDFSNAMTLGNNGQIYVAGVTFGSVVPGQNVGLFDMFIQEFTDSEFQLPIELASFDLEKADHSVSLSWSTFSEINNDCFNIQRSSNGLYFETIGNVKGNGNTQEIMNYSFIDIDPLNGSSYYRLEQVDFDGSTSYSAIKSVYFTNSKEITIFPNPTSDYLTIENFDVSNSNISIYNILGQKMDFKCIDNSSSSTSIDTKGFAKGQYVIKINEIQKSFIVR